MVTTPPVPACIAQWNRPANAVRLAVSRLHPKSATVSTEQRTTFTWQAGGLSTQTSAMVRVFIFFLAHKTVFAMGDIAAGAASGEVAASDESVSLELLLSA